MVKKSISPEVAYKLMQIQNDNIVLLLVLKILASKFLSRGVSKRNYESRFVFIEDPFLDTLVCTLNSLCRHQMLVFFSLHTSMLTTCVLPSARVAPRS